MIGIRIICLLIGYAFGLFQTAYIYGRSKGIDIRTQGSGNAGTTNALRTLGHKAGAIVLIGDMLKCILAVLLTWLIFGRNYPEYTMLLKIWTAFGVILGHDFPFYMHFKGGKGIAATAGLMFAFGDLKLLLIAAVVFLGILFTTHYVSLGSIMGNVVIFLYILIWGLYDGYGMSRASVWEMIIIVAVIAAMAIWNHRTNIGRLLSGSERKTYLTKKSDK